MAYATTHSPASTVLDILAAPFRAIGHGMIRIMESNSRLQHIERLQAMSDEQLAERGLTRNEIVQHVFRDLYGI